MIKFSKYLTGERVVLGLLSHLYAMARGSVDVEAVIHKSIQELIVSVATCDVIAVIPESIQELIVSVATCDVIDVKSISLAVFSSLSCVAYQVWCFSIIRYML